MEENRENNAERGDVVFKKQLKPVMNELIRICNENHMPCFIACGTSMTEKGGFNIKAAGLIPEMYGIKTNDRRFADFMNILNGHIAKFPDKREIYSENEFLFAGKEDIEETEETEKTEIESED